MSPDRPESASASASEELARIIERAKQELEQMIDLNPDVMVLVESDGTIRRTGRACLRLLQLDSFSDVLGKRLDELLDFEDPAVTAVLQGQAAGRAVVETPAVLPGGHRRLLRISAVGPGEARSARVLLLRDITEDRRRAEDDEKAHKKEALDVVVRTLKHKVNQMLTVIMTRARLIHMALGEENPDTTEMTGGLEEIMTLTMDVAESIDQLGAMKGFVTSEYLGGEYSAVGDILRVEPGSGDS